MCSKLETAKHYTHMKLGTYTQSEKSAVRAIGKVLITLDDAEKCDSFEYAVLISELSRVEMLRERREKRRLRERMERGEA